MKLPVSLCLCLFFPCSPSGGDGGAGGGEGRRVGEISPALRQAIDKLDLPGVKINVEERSVDIEAVVCLREGLLELVACAEDSKEHESIVALRARPSHIHTALLLWGARPGQPAMRRMIEGEEGRFVDLPPRGDPIRVYLLIEDEAGGVKEHPISEFIEGSGAGDGSGPDRTGEGEAFPAHSFVFAGSILEEVEGGMPRYLSDWSGNVISLATFGDEVLCLPGVYDQSNGALQWQVKGEGLPEVGSEIVLRLRVGE